MLLRARLGSAHAVAAPHAEGARIVMLDERLVRAKILAHEWHEGAELHGLPAGGGRLER